MSHVVLPALETHCEVVPLDIHAQGDELCKTNIHTNHLFPLASTCAVIHDGFLWFIMDLIVFSEHITFWDKNILSNNGALSQTPWSLPQIIHPRIFHAGLWLFWELLFSVVLLSMEFLLHFKLVGIKMWPRNFTSFVF